MHSYLKIKKKKKFGSYLHKISRYINEVQNIGSYNKQAKTAKL